METGDASNAAFVGTLATSLGDLPVGLGLAGHVGGDMTLRRFDGMTDAGPPRLRADTVMDPLDMLEVDEDELPGRIEMRAPYQAVLGTSQSVTESGSVTYALAPPATGMQWEITITGDDGSTSGSASFTTYCCADVGASLAGNTVGIVDPEFTPSDLTLMLDRTVLDLPVGSVSVDLDLSGALAWTPPSGPALLSGQGAAMDTGNATGATFIGTLSGEALGVPFVLPFDVDIVDHLGGDMTLRRFDASTDVGPPRLQLDTISAPLDRLELDENDQPGRIEMRGPYEAVLGSAGGVTWSISAEVVFNDVVYALVPSTPNGAIRDVTWTVDSEVLFNDVFTVPEPSSHAMIAAALPLLAALARRRARRR